MQFPRAFRTFLLRNPSRANYKFVLKEWKRLPEIDALGRALETRWFSQQIDPVLMERPCADRILVVAPHPDDDMLGPGGTLLKSIAAGARVTIVYVTSAANPTYADIGRRTLTPHAECVERETRAVAARTGAAVEFWRFEKRAIPLHAAAERLRDAVARCNPQVMFLPFFTDDHPDHRCISAIFAAAFPSLTMPRMEVWAYQVYATVLTNVIVDITETIEEKCALLACWESQRRSRDWGHYMKGLNAFNSRFLRTNEQRYAETFFVLPAADYRTLCRTYFP